MQIEKSDMFVSKLQGQIAAQQLRIDGLQVTPNVMMREHSYLRHLKTEQQRLDVQ